MDPITIGVFVLMLGAIAAGFMWLHSSETAGSNRRRAAMMKRLGFEPKLVSTDDPKTRAIGKMVARRCRKCSTEDVCEHWLDGEVKGDNWFCPNADTFDELSEAEAKRRRDAALLIV